MPFVAVIRAGVKFSLEKIPSEPLWVGRNVLSQEEIEILWGELCRLTVFDFNLNAVDEIERAVYATQEHHPHETV